MLYYLLLRDMFQISANNSKTEFATRGLKEYGCKVTVVESIAFGCKQSLYTLNGSEATAYQ